MNYLNNWSFITNYFLNFSYITYISGLSSTKVKRTMTIWWWTWQDGISAGADRPLPRSAMADFPQSDAIQESEPLLGKKHLAEDDTELLTVSSWYKKLKLWLGEISLKTFCLLSVFTMSAWLIFLGISAQSPHMVNTLPEGLATPSYYMIISQIGNLSPLLFLFLNWLFPGKIHDWAVICSLLVLSFLSCFIMGFRWHDTVDIGGEPHSLPFFMLTATTAMAYAASTLVYPAYIATFKPQYMTCIYVGIGLAGLAVGILVLIQGSPGASPCWNTTAIINSSTGDMTYSMAELMPTVVTTQPRFSVSAFCFIMCALLVVSAVAFLIIQRAPFVKKEKVMQHARGLGSSIFSGDVTSQPYQRQETGNGSMENVSNRRYNGQSSESTLTSKDNQVIHSPAQPPGSTTRLKRYQVLVLLTLQAIGSAIVLSLQPTFAPYFTLNYGSHTYMLVAGLANVATPFGCLLTLLLPAMPVLGIYIFYVVGLFMFSGQVYLAAAGENAPYTEMWQGTFMVVSINLFPSKHDTSLTRCWFRLARRPRLQANNKMTLGEHLLFAG